MKRVIPVLFLAFLITVQNGLSQISVIKTMSHKSSIDLSGLTANSAEAKLLLKTLSNDLARSGWFTISRQGQGEFRLVGDVGVSRKKMRVKCRLFRVAEKRALLSKSYSGPQNKPRMLAHEVADEIVKSVTGREGIASGRIALIGTKSQNKELYLLNLDGSGLQQLTRDKTVSMSPRWTPDGNSIIYTSYKKNYPDLYEINLQTGARNRISKYTSMNSGGAVSPNGKTMALILSGKDPSRKNPVLSNPELCVKDLHSGRITPLTKTKNAAESSPSWSPDGKEIVYVSDQSGSPQLYIISRKGGKPTRLTSRGSENVDPDWGIDGRIAYASRQGGRYLIQVIDPKTRKITTPLQDGADYQEPSWAPDGRHLAATREENYHSQVYILDIMGDSPIALTKDKGDWFSPAWAPGK